MAGVVYIHVSAPGEAIENTVTGDVFDFETFFHLHYERVVRTAARVVHDSARAEEIAAETFWKFWRTPAARNSHAKGWLYRTAIRMALDELKSEGRRIRRQNRPPNRPPPETPEEAHTAKQERDRVRLILASLDVRQSQLLLLRSSDLSYAEIAAALGLNPSSVGTLIGRAQQAFRQEYLKQYGEPANE